MKWERLEFNSGLSETAEGSRDQGLRGGISGPGKRWGHTCNAIHGGKFVYVFGGYLTGSCHFNDVHVFDTVKRKWSKPVMRGVPPSPRDGHSCTTVGNNLFVFGGTDGMNPFNDFHILDTSTNTWISPRVGGEIPAAREGHGAVLIGKRLFIFGGCGKSWNTSIQLYYLDVYVLDTETLVWQKAVTSGTAPTPRGSHTCSSWMNKIYVIGGEDSYDYYLSDVHILDTDTLIWTELRTSGHMLSPRAGHCTVALGGNLFVFGGYDDGRNLYDDLHILNVDTGVWTNVVAAGQGPSARFSVAGDCLDLQKGILMFMGGCNPELEALDDMYYLHTEISMDNGKNIRGQEKISLRKELKRKCQEHYLSASLSTKNNHVPEHRTMPDLCQSMPMPSCGQANTSAWDKLNQVSLQSNHAKFYQLQEELRGIQQGNLSIREFYTTISAIWEQQTMLDPQFTHDWEVFEEYRNKMRLFQLLMALRPEFEQVRASILRQATLPRLDDVLTELLAEEARLASLSSLRSGGSEIVPYASSSNHHASQSFPYSLSACRDISSDHCHHSRELRRMKRKGRAKLKRPCTTRTAIPAVTQSTEASLVVTERSSVPPPPTSTMVLPEPIQHVHPSPIHALPPMYTSGKQNLPLNGVKPPQEKQFEAKITEAFEYGYSIETIIDGQPLRGLIFSHPPSSSHAANGDLRGKRTAVEVSGVKSNDGYKRKLKTTRHHRQAAIDQKRVDGVQVKVSTSQESQMETALASESNNVMPVDVSRTHMDMVHKSKNDPPDTSTEIPDSATTKKKMVVSPPN